MLGDRHPVEPELIGELELLERALHRGLGDVG